MVAVWGPRAASSPRLPGPGTTPGSIGSLDLDVFCPQQPVLWPVRTPYVALPLSASPPPRPLSASRSLLGIYQLSEPSNQSLYISYIPVNAPKGMAEL